MKRFPQIKGIVSQFILTIFFAPLIFSCSKDKQTVIRNDWQVESIKIHADSALKFPGNIYTLKFEKKYYHLKLDVNTCSGKVNFKGKTKIEFEDEACTKICCDSDFSEKLINIIAKVNHYNATDLSLVLTGENGETVNFFRK